MQYDSVWDDFKALAEFHWEHVFVAKGAPEHAG